MVDASFAEVPRQRNSREDNALIKDGEVPQSLLGNAKVRAHKDLNARWTKKNNETHYGYKDHVKVDVKDKLILKAVITAASVHDSQAFDELIDEGDRVVYADSACSGEPIEAALAAKNVEPQINEPERSGDRRPQAARRVSEANQKGTRGHPLSEEQKAGNREKSRTRSRVEHVFAQMSGSMKALYQRCIGMKRNAACLLLTNLVCNMMRFEQIKRLKLNAAA